jgi:hypothetical protein
MTKKQYIGAYLDGYFSDKKIAYGFKYFQMLEQAEEKAEKKFNEYKKLKLK